MACPTYAQLEAEQWWGREVRTTELKWLGDELCRRTGAPATSIGTKGNNCHLNGGHRSQEWITHSQFCTNRHYTVQSGLTAEQRRHLAALDRTPLAWGTVANRAQVAVETKRLLDAAKAGKLKGVTQIEGTLDGKTPFGYNVETGTTFTPDVSHLDHWHLTFDRRYLTDMALMRRIAAAVLGSPAGGIRILFSQSEKVTAADPVGKEVYIAPGSSVLIMSFSHAEDLEILAQCLQRARTQDDLPYIGLIGSKSKWATFRHRLEARGFNEADFAQVTCPIGVPGIAGKQPEVIAVAVAAQLLQRFGQQA